MQLAQKALVNCASLQSGLEIESWQRMPSESARWFARFNIFRLLGSNRSIDGSWRHEERAKTNKNGRAPDSWHKAAKRFEWRERALDWDVAKAERIGKHVLEERARRLQRALQNRLRRENYLDGLDLTFRNYAEKTRSKLDPTDHPQHLGLLREQIQAHLDFFEQMMRLSRLEFAAEERLLAEVAAHQQRCIAAETPMVGITDNQSDRALESPLPLESQPTPNQERQQLILSSSASNNSRIHVSVANLPR